MTDYFLLKDLRSTCKNNFTSFDDVSAHVKFQNFFPNDNAFCEDEKIHLDIFAASLHYNQVQISEIQFTKMSNVQILVLLGSNEISSKDLQKASVSQVAWKWWWYSKLYIHILPDYKRKTLTGK